MITLDQDELLQAEALLDHDEFLQDEFELDRFELLQDVAKNLLQETEEIVINSQLLSPCPGASLKPGPHYRSLGPGGQEAGI